MSTPSTAVAAGWAQRRERGTYLLMRLMLWGLKWIARPLMLPFVHSTALYFFLFGRPTREASLDYLRRVSVAVPEAGLKADWPTAYRHFLTFGRAIIDKVDTWSGRLTVDDVLFENYADMRALAHGTRGVVIFGSHLGNLEVLRALGTMGHRVKLNVLVHTAHADYFNRIMRAAGATDIELIQVTQMDAAAALDLRARVDRGEWVVIAADRVPVHGGRTVDVQFLGDTAALPIGPYVLAHLLECPVYLLFVLRQSSRIHVYLESFAERLTWRRQVRDSEIAQYAQRYAARLEHYLRLAPLQWFNFYRFWRH